MKKNYSSLQIAFTLICLLINSILIAQTTPAAQALQYSQPFTTLVATSTIYPAGIQGWIIGASGSASFRTTAPTANSALLASSTAATVTGGVHNYNGKIGILASGTTDPAIGLAINTNGLSNIQVNFDAMTIRNPYDGTANTSINGLDLQYRVSAISGTWTSVSGLIGGVYQNNTTNQITAVTTPQNTQAKSLTLPPACNNLPAVYLRWVMCDITGTIGSGGRPSFAIDNIIICPITTPTITISGPSAFCTSQSATYVAAITNGGTTPSYQWKKNGVIAGTGSFFTFSPLIVGDQISCTLTSNAGCVTTATANSNIITIGAVSAPPTISSGVVTNVSCAGIRNGTINITVSGGTPPYTFSWDTTNIANGPLFGVMVGTKTLTLMPVGVGLAYYIDGVESKELFLTKGITYTFNVMGGHPFHISTDPVGASSVGFVGNGQSPSSPVSTGTLTFRPNSSHPTLLYYPCAAHQYMGWKVNLVDGYSTEDLTNLVAGKYSVIVTDANGCTTSSTYTVGQNSATVTASANAKTNVTCYGLPNGTIDLTPAGGTAPYVSSGTGATFTVITETKNHSNPQFGAGNANGFTIDGVQGKELTLIRGIKYAFSVLTPSHPFVISSSSTGGSANSALEITNGVINSGTTSGTLFFTPNASHPSLLFYQCGSHPNMGWKINIVNQLPNGDLGNCMAGTYDLFVSDVNGCASTVALHAVITQPAATTFYYDGDGDNYGVNTETALGCTAPPGFAALQGDCNNSNPAVRPGAIEICNGIDDNCNALTDDNDPSVTGRPIWYPDIDTDGFGDMNNAGTAACNQPPGKILNHTDCNDANINVHPGAVEICNGLDDNCNTLTDDNDPAITGQTRWYNDGDTDGFGDLNDAGVLACTQPIGKVTDHTDCNDANTNVNPGASEVCNNNMDDNCNTQIDEGCALPPVTLNLKLFLQGYYTGGGLMDNSGAGGCLYVNDIPSAVITDADTVFISAMNAVTYAEADRKTTLLQTNGNASVTFNSSVIPGDPYYIKVNHRNTLETWSGSPVIMLTTTNYDFTTDSLKAYGTNMTKTFDNMGWAFYSGDISDGLLGVGLQDGIIESRDYSDMENAVSSVLAGYIPEDITGDGVAESADYSIMENNVYYVVALMRP